jgi:hypothetical protein
MVSKIIEGVFLGKFIFIFFIPIVFIIYWPWIRVTTSRILFFTGGHGCTKNNEKQQFTRIKNPLLLENH